jgi:hypothetical protein
LNVARPKTRPSLCLSMYFRAVSVSASLFLQRFAIGCATIGEYTALGCIRNSNFGEARYPATDGTPRDGPSAAVKVHSLRVMVAKAVRPVYQPVGLQPASRLIGLSDDGEKGEAQPSLKAVRRHRASFAAAICARSTRRQLDRPCNGPLVQVPYRCAGFEVTG